MLLQELCPSIGQPVTSERLYDAVNVVSLQWTNKWQTNSPFFFLVFYAQKYTTIVIFPQFILYEMLHKLYFDNITSLKD